MPLIIQEKSALIPLAKALVQIQEGLADDDAVIITRDHLREAYRVETNDTDRKIYAYDDGKVWTYE